MTDDEFLKQANIALANNKKYDSDSQHLPVGQLSIGNDLPQDIQDRWLDIAMQYGFDLTFDKTKGHQALSVGDIVNREPLKKGRININPSQIILDENGGVFFIDSGLTHKRTIDRKEYGVIENILVPADIVFHHEIGHLMGSRIRNKKDDSFKGDRITDSRFISPFALSGNFNQEDALNISGQHFFTENEKRHQLGLPYRWGYLNPQSLYGGKQIFESIDKIKETHNFIRSLKDNAVGDDAKVTISYKLNDFLNKLQEDEKPINYNKVALEFMKFPIVEKVVTKAKETTSADVLRDLFFGTDSSYKMNKETRSRTFLTKKNEDYKTKKKKYDDGSMRYDEPKGYFATMNPSLATILMPRRHNNIH